jgi:ABC-type multidrug transport system ATPase subunit
MRPVIDLRHVSKRYGPRVAVDSVTMAVKGGEILAVIGPNGAGKTTLLRLMAGLLRPTTGTILRTPGGRSPGPSGPSGRREPREHGPVRYFGGEQTLPPRVPARRWHALWDGAAASATTTLPFGTLSRGTRQRIGLEAALAARDFSVLLLDDPWQALDAAAARWLTDRLVSHRGGTAAIVVSSRHVHELAAICDRCEFLVEGRVAGQGAACAHEASLDERAACVRHGFDLASRRV